ncbi:MAG: HDIG domain-containing protein [Anaerolineales bacterium]|nr:HDIG domain-containing protein [Anaerolineales bacterium]
MTSREEALTILDEFIQNENLKRHMYAVEAAIRDYALDFGEDPDLWGLAGLLHDFDWEIHPSLDAHAQDGAPILRARGVPEDVIQCILSHVDFTGVPRNTQMAKSLFACDEITGLITAAALVRPSKSILDLKVKSIKKKWKDKRFAAAVDRDEIEKAAEELGVELWSHVDHVLHSMQRIAPEIGLE